MAPTEFEPVFQSRHAFAMVLTSPSDARRVMPPVLRGIRRVLDIGCGAGQTLIAADMGGAYKTCIDCDFEALQLGRQLCSDIHVVHAAGEALPFRDTHTTLSSREWHCPICIFQRQSAKRLASLLQMDESGLSCTRCPCCPGSETCCRFGEQYLDYTSA